MARLGIHLCKATSVHLKCLFTILLFQSLEWFSARPFQPLLDRCSNLTGVPRPLSRDDSIEFIHRATPLCGDRTSWFNASLRVNVPRTGMVTLNAWL